MKTVIRDQARQLPHYPAHRGYHAVYRQQEVNHCPGCGRSHWLVGRMSAECGFCSTALPFAGAVFASERLTSW